ncbi:MAG: hypothetical protein PHD86_04340 [Kiritimatiellae bacterium]|nr:hypothetical protein [Kiritimatiellia bacterium]
MSLIQEALRRKEADDKGVPPPPPVPSPASKKDSPLKAVIAVLAVLLVLIGVAVYLFTYLVNSFTPRRIAPPAPVQMPEAVKPAPVQVVEKTPEPEPPEVLESEPVAAAAPVREIPEPAPEPVVAEAPRPEPVPEPVSVAAAEPVRLEEKTVAQPAPVEWPNLNLTGVLRKGGSGGPASAMISGELVSVSETIRGVRLVAVEASGVWLELNGEQKFLAIGRSLK